MRRKKIERQNELLFNPVRHIELGGTHHDLVIAVIFNGQTVGFVFGFRKEKRHFLVDFYLKGLAATGTVGRKLGFDRKQCTCQATALSRTRCLPIDIGLGLLALEHLL